MKWIQRWTSIGYGCTHNIATEITYQRLPSERNEPYHTSKIHVMGTFNVRLVLKKNKNLTKRRLYTGKNNFLALTSLNFNCFRLVGFLILT